MDLKERDVTGPKRTVGTFLCPGGFVGPAALCLTSATWNASNITPL